MAGRGQSAVGDGPGARLAGVLPAVFAAGLVVLLLAGCGAPRPYRHPVGRKPNLLLVTVEALGWADLRGGRMPRLAALAEAGMRFTDVHSPAAAPRGARYGLLTGRYPWRVAPAPAVVSDSLSVTVEPGRPTLPALLRQSGYRTRGVGFWSLGRPGLVGYDRFEDPRPPGGPTAGEVARFAGRAVEILKRYRASRSTRPLFLHLALPGPAAPWGPSPEAAARYARHLDRCDRAVGDLVAALGRTRLRDRTLLLVVGLTAPAAPDRVRPRSVSVGAARPTGPFRGWRGDLFEGGHRVPLLAAWPGTVPPGRVCAAPRSVLDLLATACALAGADLPAAAGVDSRSLLPDLVGKGGDDPVRVLLHRGRDGDFAVRAGRYKLLLCPGSGGPGHPRRSLTARLPFPAVQLYDLKADPGERVNLQALKPDTVARLRALMAEVRAGEGG